MRERRALPTEQREDSITSRPPAPGSSAPPRENKGAGVAFIAMSEPASRGPRASLRGGHKGATGEACFGVHQQERSRAPQHRSIT